MIPFPLPLFLDPLFHILVVHSISAAVLAFWNDLHELFKTGDREMLRDAFVEFACCVLTRGLHQTVDCVPETHNEDVQEDLVVRHRSKGLPRNGFVSGNEVLVNFLEVLSQAFRVHQQDLSIEGRELLADELLKFRLGLGKKVLSFLNVFLSDEVGNVARD